jgi:peroxiredoxin
VALVDEEDLDSAALREELPERAHRGIIQRPWRLPRTGDKAPAFALEDQSGTTHRLKDYAGQPLILYFYPKDDTPGCTKEACDFRDHLPKFDRSKAAVLGVSILDTASKAKFAKKHGLKFPLLADADHSGRGEVRRLAEEVALRAAVHGHRPHEPSSSGPPARSSSAGKT